MPDLVTVLSGVAVVLVAAFLKGIVGFGFPTTATTLLALAERSVAGADRSHAALDEFHQSFVASRHASPWDALIDTTGATVAQVVLWLWQLRNRKVTDDY